MRNAVAIAGHLVNLAAELQPRLPHLNTEVVTIQPKAITFDGTTWRVVDWGEPIERLRTRKALHDGRKTRQPNLTPTTFEAALRDPAKLGQLSEESLCEAARLAAADANMRGRPLLIISRALFVAVGARRGVEIDLLRDEPALSPQGAEAMLV